MCGRFYFERPNVGTQGYQEAQRTAQRGLMWPGPGPMGLTRPIFFFRRNCLVLGGVWLSRPEAVAVSLQSFSPFRSMAAPAGSTSRCTEPWAQGLVPPPVGTRTSSVRFGDPFSSVFLNSFFFHPVVREVQTEPLLLVLFRCLFDLLLLFSGSCPPVSHL